MKTHIFPAIRLTLLSLIAFSGIYTGIVWGIALLSPNQGKGEKTTYKNRTYFSNIGQSFTDDSYFQSRPSAVDYNAAGSGGSNSGPSNPEYLATVQARIDTFLLHNPGIHKQEIPVELVTASGSGLDPHISVKAARVQVKRIAAIRGISEQMLYQLIDEHREQPLGGLFGPEVVNVLKINSALEHLQHTK
jgi:K+-transporting ATPase ATPase C chain